MLCLVDRGHQRSYCRHVDLCEVSECVAEWLNRSALLPDSRIHLCRSSLDLICCLDLNDSSVAANSPSCTHSLALSPNRCDTIVDTASSRGRSASARAREAGEREDGVSFCRAESTDTDRLNCFGLGRWV